MRGPELLQRLNRMFRRADQAVALGCLCGSLAACHDLGKAPDLSHAPPSLSSRFLAPRGWTWSKLELKNGASLQYGVASPPVTPHGAVLIVPDRNEPGEVWFETANDLLDRGYTVWLLEIDTKGGEALDPNQSALSTMVRDIIRPTTKAPLVVVAQGLGSTFVLAGLSAEPDIKGALLSSPALSPASGFAANMGEWVSKIDLGWLALPGSSQPSLNDTPVLGLDPRRAGLAGAWRRSEPNLRAQKANFGWAWAYNRAAQSANAPRPTATRVIMAATVGDARASAVCRRLSTCRPWILVTSAPHLAADTQRKPWLDRIAELLEGRADGAA